MMLNSDKLVYFLLAITAIPHLFHLPLLINIYLLIFFIFYFNKNRINKNLALIFFFIIGVVLGLIEYIQYVNIIDLSKAQVFIDIVSSLLVFIVSLQMISDFKSVLIKISPILLLITSLFYFNNMLFLAYTVLVLFVTVNAIMFTNAKIDIKVAFRYSLSIFIASIPIVVILFLVFPRISYKKGDFGFKNRAIMITGFGDSVTIGDDHILLLSDKVAMEISFLDKIPRDDQLYFRGAVLYEYDGDKNWHKLKDFEAHRYITKQMYQRAEDVINYSATIYPTWKNIIFSLDMPLSIPKDARISNHQILKAKKQIKDVKRYNLKATLKYKISKINEKLKEMSLKTSQNNPRTKELAKKIKKASKNEEEILKNIIKFFIKQKFQYTLKPSKLSSNNKIDELIFSTKNGYCVHFSTAFAYLARECGIPTRVVTGYKADSKESIKNYLLVREKHAHAWIEIYLKNRGWSRIDPTTYSLSNNITQSGIGTTTANQANKSQFGKKFTLYVMYMKYKIENWVLYYSRGKQIKLLKEIKADKKILFYYAASFMTLFFFSYLAFKSLTKNRNEDKVLLLYKKFLKKLEKQGYIKESYEGAFSFANRVNRELNLQEVENITKIYIELKYHNNISKNLFGELKRAVNGFKIVNKL